MKLSVAIPTHGMDDRIFFFERCLESLWSQSFQDFEIVVTDNSDDALIEDTCKFYQTGIKYFRNPNKGMAQNTNEAIRRSTGDLIKILYMDDYLLDDGVLEDVVEKFTGEWLICGSDNNPNPEWTEDIQTGNNKLGSPSTLTVRNKKPLLFDESLTWLLDCDLYRRYFQEYGEPKILGGEMIGIGRGEHQMTYLISDERKLQEHDYMIQKHG